MKCYDFDEKQIVVQNPILLNRFIAYKVKYLYPSKKIGRLVIESKWSTCLDLSKMIRQRISEPTKYELLISPKKSISLTSVLNKINHELISKKQSIITSSIKNANIDDWKNLLGHTGYGRSIFEISNKSIIEKDGVKISIENLLAQKITKCNIKIFFKTDIIFNKVAITKKYSYLIIHKIHHMKITTDINNNINPDDQNIKFVVEI